MKKEVVITLAVLLGLESVCGNLLHDLRDCPSFLPRSQYVKPYGNLCLFFVTTKYAWNDANSNCRRHGGHLVQIENQQKQNFVYNTLKSLHWKEIRVWIGANDRATEGTWKWTDGTKLTYSHWHAGEGPSHSGFLFQSGYEDCAIMKLDDGGRWHDYDCGGVLFLETSVCEYKKIRRTTTTLRTTTKSTTPKPTTQTTTIPTTTRETCVSFLPGASLVKFYRHSCLRFVKREKSWNDANTECTNQGGQLLQIHSQQDQDFVYQSLKSLHWSDAGAWIGATDRVSEGHWSWTDGSPVQYGHWNRGEGPHHNTTNENCAMINVDDGMWYDYNCGSVIYNQAYICQYRL
ncbi:macrophage mannose receptor 1-like [Ylistrum balloti]|uniref:macrophage mannose receptor 1-like n=1 Tax=Ylistrum balloti TaxID=509963 RepID=UPI002905E91D|nr:macrophage mannose receptor 1-like [Ylistrum balloti]